MKLHGEEVKVRDRVWHILKGWVEVIALEEEGCSNYPICVRCEEGCEWFTEDGKKHVADIISTLFWQPIEFKLPKKPKKKKKKAWQWVCKSGKRYYLTRSYYTSKEEVSALAFAAEPIEPYVRSEIEMVNFSKRIA